MGKSREHSPIYLIIVLLCALCLILIPSGTALAADCVPGKDVDEAFLAEVVKGLTNPVVPDDAVPFAVAALKAWMPYENTDACWNPLATTLYMLGTTDFNSAHVRNYPDAAMGAAGTATTLNFGSYAAIRQMLARQAFEETGLRSALTTWTGSGGYSSSLIRQWRTLFDKFPGCVHGARFITQSRYPTMWPEQAFELWFDLENTGTCAWRPTGSYQLINTNHIGLGAPAALSPLEDVNPGESYHWIVPMLAPSAAGVYIASWQMAYKGRVFGDGLWIRVSVVEQRDDDNRPGGANELLVATSQIHSLTPAGDEDWFTFTLQESSQVTVRIAGESGDTQLWLYDQSETELAYNDDADDSYFSQVETSCDAEALSPGQYYVKVAAYDPAQVLSHYTVHLLAEPCPEDGPLPEQSTPTPTPTMAPEPGTRYGVNETGPVCGGIIAFELMPSADRRMINFRMTKCDDTPIRLDGNLYIVVDGIFPVGPYRYHSGEMGVDGWLDPLGDLGLSGEHRYEAYVYPDGQDYPIISGVILAWDVNEVLSPQP